MFHRFCQDTSGDRRHLDRSTLEWQVRYLARNHTPWTPDQHLAAVEGPAWPGGTCPVVVTVDDGYEDFADFAFPVFREHGIPVMFFVTTGFVEGTTWFWWDQVQYALDRTKVQRWEFALGSEVQTFDLRTDAGRSLAWDRITDHGRILADDEKQALVDSVAESLGVELPVRAPGSYAALSWDRLREMAADGLLVGAHTQTHPILSRVSEDRARREIEGSKVELERHLGRAVDWFCYPQGGPIDYNATVRDIVAESFRGCYVAYQTPYDPEDPMTLPRYAASRDLTAFRWSMCGAEYIARRIRRLVRDEPRRTDVPVTSRPGPVARHETPEPFTGDPTKESS